MSEKTIVHLAKILFFSLLRAALAVVVIITIAVGA